MKNRGSGFIITALASGIGKTTVTSGILRALKRGGYCVAPFKTGPDYIDPMLHKIASGCSSINLDVFMSGEEGVRRLVKKYSEGKEVCVIEGVMGMLDGYDRKKGSASHISALTGFPLVVVIDAHSSGYSLSPVLWGVKNYDLDSKIAGVIFNNVASERHLGLLKNAAEDAGIEFLGYLKRNNDLELPSRHLGLCADDEEVMESFIERASEAVEEGIEIEKLLAATVIAEDYGNQNEDKDDGEGNSGQIIPKLRIAVASDEAFNFIYRENIESLRRNSGGEIIEFSPLRDAGIPDADILYFPGGYPELYAAMLESNESMRRSVREFIEGWGYVIAECGGMLYLTEGIENNEMCGILPARATMRDSRLHLGYRKMKYNGLEIRGHEFHYSKLIEDKGRIEEFIVPAEQYNLRGEKVETALYRYKNAFMGYTHLYWGEMNILKLWQESIHGWETQE